MKARTLLEKLDRIPPCLCRILAHQRTRGLSHEEIARKAGLSVYTISKLSLKTTWKGIPPETIDKFASACGVDILRIKRTRHYIREKKMIHITFANREQKKLYARIFKLTPMRNPPPPPMPHGASHVSP